MMTVGTHPTPRGYERAVGFDEGYAAEQLAASGIPTVSDLDSAAAKFDVVSAVEVIEHVVDPVNTFRQIMSLLKPGGLLILTTGNAQPFRGRLSSWSYVVPDVHVSYFEPETLERAMSSAGLAPQRVGYSPGWNDIIRYKVLKAFGVRRRNGLERLVPWPLVSRVVDRALRVTAQPVAWRRQ